MKVDFGKLKKNTINLIKKLGKRLIKILLPIIIVFVLLGAIVYFITIDDGTYKEDDWSNTPYAASQYTGNISAGEDGKLQTSMSAQELWDKMKDNGSRVDLYLDEPEELLKLMNAELVTQLMDTREDPDEEIDWDEINDINMNDVQGIIKLKRADDQGNKSTMTYVDPETFQKYIDNYNESGSESDRKTALSHFTLETITSAPDSGTSSPITAGTSIKVPAGLGSVHTYMGWQMITSTTSTQYKLREKAGMLFDSEGFGKINNRYVIACTTTFGKVGDYIDFYQQDGTIIPCIIGDIKSQTDAGCTKWGHNDGHCIIEFIVDKETWYNSGHPNPGTNGCHPEWNKNITKAVNGGSYFDNPNFGTDSIAENSSDNSNSDTPEAMKWPTDGTNITSQFGLRDSPTAGASSNHRGIDIGVSEGTNVYACEDGKVTTASYSDTAGNWVVIDHGNGYISKYMHNSELKVDAGDTVKKGDIIALSGNTGVSTGAHLHFQIEYEGSAVDPLSFKYDNGMGDGEGGVGKNSNSDGSNTKFVAKVATWSETTNTVESNDPEVSGNSTTTYNMTSTNINYQDFVSGYTMPFDYLWSLLVVGEDKDFVLGLADLVYNSDIEITVHDNLTVDTNTVVKTYTKKKRTDTEATVTVNYGADANSTTPSTVSGSWSDEESTDYKVTDTVVTKTNTLDIALTRANVWIVDYSQEYTYQQPETTTTNNTEDIADKNYPDTPDATSTEDTYGHAAGLLESEKAKYTSTYAYVDGKIDSISAKIYNARVNQKKETTNSVETTKYVPSPAKTIEKTDIDAEEDNFVTILNKDECKKGKLNILSVPEWLYEILENNESTADMVDLTKYLLYKLTGHSYGVTEYDFSAYDPANFTSVNNGTKSNLDGVPGQIADFLLAKGMPIEGVAAVLGNIEQESTFNPKSDSGSYIGLVQWGGSRATQLKQFAQSKNKEWTDTDIQLEFMWKELTSNGYSTVKTKLMNDSDVNNATEYFAKNYEKCVNGDGSIQQLDKRQQYAQKWYEELKRKSYARKQYR